MSESDKEQALGESFRQSKKEMWFMVACWIVFASWTIGYNALNAFDAAGSGDDPVWGMPRWVVFGIAAPWALALVLTTWFALRFMKDTPLGEEDATSDEGEGSE
ncbi:MAG: DUF997 family protein [Verrucomicrobiales bacterium]